MTAAPFTPPPASPVHDLWSRYRSTGDPDARARLLERHLGLVHHVARAVGSRLPVLEVDELASAGTLGLVRALDSFDPGRGLAFSTYAMRRIRGAILDDLRSRDWTPRSVRHRNRRLLATTAALEGKLGRAPEPREIAEALEIGLETYWEWRSALGGGVMLSLDGAPPARSGAYCLEEIVDDPETPSPDHDLIREETVGRIRSHLLRLPEKDRTVLALYYYEELNLRQIGEVLQVSESRVSQIRTRALRRLRERMDEHAPDS